MKTENFRYTATCLFGLEGLLGEEIDSLGYRRVNTMDGRITFEGDAYACCVCNINLRFAERLYLNMGEFEARSCLKAAARCPGRVLSAETTAFPYGGIPYEASFSPSPTAKR